MSKYIGITFLQVGKLRLHKLCQNKHFSTADTISPDSKRKTFSHPYHSFQPFALVLLKYVSVFPCLGVFPISLVILLSSLLPASSLEISEVALLKSTHNFHGILCLEF